MAVDEALRWIGLPVGEPIPRGSRVLVDSLFRRQVAVALPESAIVDREYGESEVSQLFEPEHLTRQVPASTVQIEHHGRLRIRRRPPPGMDVLRVASLSDRQVELLNAVRQPGVPPRDAVHDAKR